MIRLDNWQSRLSDYIIGRAQQPFKYGVMDCGLFVAGAIEAMTAVDVANDLKGHYSSRKEAFDTIKGVCGKGTVKAIADHIAAKYGISETPVLCAQRGDPVLLTSGLGIVDMNAGFILTPYKRGLLRLPLSSALKAWHI
jgi:hypothetical protein